MSQTRKMNRTNSVSVHNNQTICGASHKVTKTPKLEENGASRTGRIIKQ